MGYGEGIEAMEEPLADPDFSRAGDPALPELVFGLSEVEEERSDAQRAAVAHFHELRLTFPTQAG